MAATEEVVIVDSAGTEHVFPPGFDPKRAAAIVAQQTPPKATQNPLLRKPETNTPDDTPTEGASPVSSFGKGLFQSAAYPSSLGDLLGLVLPSVGAPGAAQMLPESASAIKPAIAKAGRFLLEPKKNALKLLNDYLEKAEGAAVEGGLSAAEKAKLAKQGYSPEMIQRIERAARAETAGRPTPTIPDAPQARVGAQKAPEPPASAAKAPAGAPARNPANPANVPSTSRAPQPSDRRMDELVAKFSKDNGPSPAQRLAEQLKEQNRTGGGIVNSSEVARDPRLQALHDAAISENGLNSVFGDVLKPVASHAPAYGAPKTQNIRDLMQKLETLIQNDPNFAKGANMKNTARAEDLATQLLPKGSGARVTSLKKYPMVPGKGAAAQLRQRANILADMSPERIDELLAQLEKLR